MMEKPEEKPSAPPPPPRYGAEVRALVGEKLSFGEKVKGFLASPTNTFNRAYEIDYY